MTTKQQSTPYDSKIEARPECDGFDTTLLLLVAQREGYLVAKAEFTDLLALLTSYVDKLDDQGLSNREVKNWLDDQWIPDVRAAIARAKKEEA